MARFEQYCRDIGIGESQIEKMNDEKIGVATVPHMSDSELMEFIPKTGHRILVRQFCMNEVGDEDQKKKQNKETLLNKIKLKLGTASASGQMNDTKHRAKRSSRGLLDRPVEFGLGMFNTDKQCYKSINRTMSGGIRQVRCIKTAKKSELIEQALQLYNLCGIDDTYEVEMATDIAGRNIIKDEDTVESLYQELKMKTIRCYLPCRKKTVVADKETDDSLPDIPDLLRLLQEPEAHVSQNSLDEGLPASGREDILQEAMDIAIANSLQTEPPHTINQDNSNEPRPPLHREDENQAPAAYLTPEMAPIQQMQTPEADPRPTTTYSDAPLATYTNLGTPTVYARETTESPTAHDNLIDALFELECRSEPLQTDKANVVNVCRDDVLDGGLRAFARKNFNPANKLSVRFAGEPGTDNGGPMRDFLRLAMTAIEERYFTPDTPKHIKLKSTAVTDGEYHTVGIFMAYSIVHRGPLPRFCSAMLYNIFDLGTDRFCDIECDLGLLDAAMRENLKKVSDATNKDDFHTNLEDFLQLVDIAGCSGLMSFDKRDQLVNQLCRFLLLQRQREPLDQMISGLKTLGVLEMLWRVPSVMGEAFVYCGPPELTAENIEALFIIKSWSQEGSNRRAAEQKTISFWRDFLIDAESEPGALADVLQFSTGSRELPPLGLNPTPTIVFRHPEDLEENDATKEFPVANTCGNVLHLHVVNNYRTFQQGMKAAAAIDMFTME